MERLGYELEVLRGILTKEASWIKVTESCRVSKAESEIRTAYLAELAASELVLDMVFRSIESCEAISAHWFVSSDAVTVQPNLHLL